MIRHTLEDAEILLRAIAETSENPLLLNHQGYEELVRFGKLAREFINSK